MDSDDLLEVMVEGDGEFAEVTITGELDMATAKDLHAALSSVASERPSYLRLDISALSFMDVKGLDAIVAADQRARAGGFQLEITPGTELVQRLFQLAGVESELPFAGSLSTHA
jgi:anti-sigma B factor antagonist